MTVESEREAARAATGPAPADDALLVDPRRGWLVEEGELELFVVVFEDGEAVAWEPFGRLGPGSLLGGAGVGPRAGLVARVSAEARLRGLWLDERDGDEGARAAAADRWLEAALDALRSTREEGRPHPLAGELRGASPGLPVRTLSAGASDEPLEEMQIALPPRGPTWVEVRKGSVRVLGRERSRALGPGELAPLGGADWLLTEGDAAVSLRDTAAVAAAGALAAGLAAFAEEAVETVARRAERAEARERERLRERRRREERTLDEVVLDFRAVLDQRVAPLRALADGPAYAAVRIVGAHLGVVVRGPASSAQHGPRIDVISRIAQASRLRTRPVELAGRWWRKDFGPLVGILREGDVPVALIPGRFGYRLHDPETGLPRRVRAADIAGLRTEAREFYRPLPAEPVGAHEVLRFATRGLRGETSVLILSALAVAAIGLLVPVLTGVILGRLVPQAQSHEIAQLSILLLVSAFVSALLNVVFNLAGLRIEGRLDHRLQAGVWDRLLGLPAHFFRDYSTGQLATAALGISTTREVLSGVTFRALLAAVVAAADLALIAALDVSLLLVAFAVLGVVLALALTAGRTQARHERAAHEREKEVNSRTYQLISGVAKVSTAAAETRAFAHWGRAFAAMRRQRYAARAGQNRLTAFNGGLTLLGAGVAFFVVGDLIDIPRSTFLIFNVAYFQVLASVLQLASAAMVAVEAVPSLESLRPLLDARPEKAVGLQDPGRLSGAIELDRVTFSYAAGGTPALDDVSFSVHPGEFIGVVGPSGSGKSTLVRLLLAFEAPQSGTLLYDDQDLGDLDPIAVRRQCGAVLQDARLFAGDILTNIIGTGLYTYDDAWEALRMVGLDEAVGEMPMGVYTMLSDAGAGLSGGQRQRLLLARALVARPSIVILDEATSALDNRAQEHVMESMKALKATRVVIAHRLSTIRDADRIVVLDGGRLAQEGAYDELMERDGPFRELARRQLV